MDVRLKNIYNSFYENIIKISSITLSLIMKFSVRKLWKSFCVVMLFIQLLQLTIDYSEYHTVIDMKVGKNKLSTTPLSLCINSKQEYYRIKSEKSVNQTVGEYLKQNIICVIRFKNGSYILCNKTAFIIESVTPFSYRCITYFSQLYDSNPISSNVIFYNLCNINNIDLFG